MAITETFWDQIGAYNDATFPLQMIMVVVAMILMYYVFAKPTRKTNRQNALGCTNVTRIAFYSEREHMFDHVSQELESDWKNQRN